MKKNTVFLTISLLFLGNLAFAQKQQKPLDPFERMEQQMREMREQMSRMMQQQDMFMPSFDSLRRGGGHSFGFFNDGSGWKSLDSLGGGMTQIDTVMTDENGNRFSFKFFGNGGGMSQDFFREQQKQHKELLDRMNKPLPQQDRVVPRTTPQQDDKKKKYKMHTL